MLTRNDVFALLESFGIRRDDVVTIHSSLREVGPIEGGADGLIDALKDYLCDGLLLIPTHTWAVVNAANPHFDVRSTVPNIGTLSRVAAFRKDAVRSLHPTHSMAAFGKNARAYIQGEEKFGTPAPVGGALSRLYELNGKVLLVGVGHERNTYLHSIDERVDQPNRLSPNGFAVEITDWNGHVLRNEDFHPHRTEGISCGLSEYYRNYKHALDVTGAVQYGWLGNALTYCCDCRKMTDTVLRILKRADRDVCIGIQEIPEEWYL
ncbi:MAG: AAC(3) family N-acetyltransferase [Clostridia bacterium]|nr:AAC(3) family N-acetyltransferase [Clostridia bacterium]